MQEHHPSNTTTINRATPVTMTMTREAFLDWLFEVKGNPEGRGWDKPDFYMEEITGPNFPYEKAEGFTGTAEGTVVARYLRDGDEVRVTFGGGKPGENLMRAVRWMLGDEGEPNAPAAGDFLMTPEQMEVEIQRQAKLRAAKAA